MHLLTMQNIHSGSLISAFKFRESFPCGWLMKHHTVNVHGEVELQLHAFLTMAEVNSQLHGQRSLLQNSFISLLQIWCCSQAGSHCMMIYVWRESDINCLYFFWVCYYVWFYRGGQILNDAGLTAGSLQNDIEDLEAKENMLDKLITSAGRVEYHVILQN